MGILVDALSIACGGFLGGRLKKGMSQENNRILGIGIMIVSLVGFFENIYNVLGESIASENLMIVLFAYMIGSKTGEFLHLEEKLAGLGRSEDGSRNAFLDAVLFFGVGGLQICGPVAAIQVLIAAAAFACSTIFSNEMTAQLCAMGYIILFFSGFNLITDRKYKISNMNMLPGILFLALYHVVAVIFG